MSNPTEDFRKVGARKLRFLMEANHLTIAQLADAADIGHATLQELADGRANPSEGVMRKLTKHFGVPESYFGVGGSDEGDGAKAKAGGTTTQRSGNKKPRRPAAPEALTLKSLAVRYQALLELMISKGVCTAAEYRDQVAEVEKRK